MTTLGYILLVLGCLIGLVGDLRFMVITYRQGLGWFFTCLFFPIVGWIFFLMHFKEARRPVLQSTAGFVIAGVGYSLGGFTFLS